MVDVHNQARQFELALEKKWITHETYFCLHTAYIGMMVKNLWKNVKTINNKRVRPGSIQDFADELAYEIVESANEESMSQQDVTVTDSDTVSDLSSTLRSRE